MFWYVMCPTWDEQPTNITLEYFYNSLAIDFNASDDVGIHLFSVNNSNNFTIDANGLLENKSLLAIGAIDVLIGVDDEAGNVNYLTFTVNVTDTQTPSWSGNETNTTAPARFEVVNFSIIWNDPSSIFCWFSYKDGIANWLNTTPTRCNSGKRVSYEIQIDATSGELFNYTFYANDSSDNRNKSDYYDLTIENTAPSITVFNMTDDDPATPGYQIDPIVDSIKTFSVWFNVSDPDGYTDINVSWIVVYNLSTDTPTYSNFSLIEKSCSGTSCVYNGSITIWHYDLPGEWNITVYANDSSDATTNYKTTFNVTPQRGFTLFNSPVQFGSLLPNVANQNASPANGFPLKIKNSGNVNVSMSIIAESNITGYPDSSYSIPITNIEYANVSTFATFNYLNLTPVNFTSNLEINTNHSLYFRISVPQIKAQQYNTTITFETTS